MGTVSERLALIIDAASSGAVRALKDTSKAAREVDDSVDGLNQRSQAVRNTLAGGLGITGLQGRLSQLGPAGTRVSAGLDSIVASASGVGPAGLAAGAGIAIGVGIAAKAVFSGIERVRQLTGEVRAYKAVTGASAEESSYFAGALRILGVDVSSGTTAFVMLAKTVEKTPQKLESQGVAIARNRQGYADLSGTLANVAQRYKDLSDAGDKAGALTLARDAFGRGFKDLIPLLARGKDGLQEFYDVVEQSGAIFSDEDLQKAKELAIAERELKAQWQAISVEIGKVALPILLDFVNGLRDAVSLAQSIKLPGLPKQLKPVTDGLKYVGAGPAGLVLYLSKVIRGSDDTAEAAATAAEGMDALGDAMADAAEETDEQAKALNAARSAFDASISSQRALEAAERGVASASRSVRDARERLNDTIARGADVTRRIEQAQRSLAKADHSVADAEERVVEARKALNALMAGPTPKEQQKAELARDQADLGVEQAERRVAEAQKRLDEARNPSKKASGSRFPGANGEASQADTVAAAELELEEAMLGVEQATIAQSDAHDDLESLLNRNKEGSRDLADAQRTLRDAEEGVTDATEAREDALRSLTEAQKGIVEHEREVARAAEGVRDAESQVAQAIDARTFALLNVARAHEAENKMTQDGLVGLQLLRAELKEIVKLYPELQPLLDRVNASIGVARAQLRPPVQPSTYQQGSYADGDIFNSPTYGVFGEAGPEMILPLAPGKRARAMHLLAKSGLIQGSQRFGNGGMFGAGISKSDLQAASSGGTFMSLSIGQVVVRANDESGGRRAARGLIDQITRELRGGVPMPAWANRRPT